MIQKGRSRRSIERQGEGAGDQLRNKGKEQEIKRGTGGRSSISGEIQKGRNRQLGERGRKYDQI